MPVITNNTKTGHFCTVRRFEDPNKSNPKDWYWIIGKAELTRISELLGFGKLEYEKDDIAIDIDTERVEIPLLGAK